MAQESLMRRGLRGMVEQQSGWEIVADTDMAEHAADGANGLDKLIADVALVDADMPNIEKSLHAMMRAAPETRVLALGVRFSEVLTCAAADADGLVCMSKCDSEFQIVQAVENLMRIKPRFPGEVIRRLGHGPASLTKRETEVVRLLAIGYSIEEAATNLGLRKSTIFNLRSLIMNKLFLSDFNELIRYAVRHSIIEP
jgi:DNA-binding NarL/FixJ family response regulator